MNRENRYVVLKWRDIEKYLSQTNLFEFHAMLMLIKEGREKDGKANTDYVVVGSDWPMYEQTWKAIEDWVDGKVKHER